MTRIIAGGAGSIPLEVPDAGTRPTSERVRESLIGALESAGAIAGSAVLDLYAGSGALGLEACSRGAAHALLVERDRRTAAVISTNVRALGLTGARVVTGAVRTVLASAPDQPYDLVLADPPYPLDDDEVEADLAALVEHRWLAPDALVVVERGRRSPEPAWPVGFTGQRRRKYGETTLWSAEWPGPSAQPEE